MCSGRKQELSVRRKGDVSYQSPWMTESTRLYDKPMWARLSNQLRSMHPNINNVILGRITAGKELSHFN
eukprot:2170113-Pyramimonas_sp.AAC.2